MINPYKNENQRRQRLILLISSLVIVSFVIFLYHSTTDDVVFTENTDANTAAKLPSLVSLRKRFQSKHSLQQPQLQSTNKLTRTLRNKKIFFVITTVGLGQFSYLEDMIDSVRDLCEAGAHVNLQIVSSNCDANHVDCEVKETTGNDTLEDNFSVETISHLNERVRCRSEEGSLKMEIRLVSPDWGKQICDHHRLLFYENIDEGYDLFVHSEDDHLIRPAQVLAFMDEMEKLRGLVGDERLTDYCIGFMRYENQARHFTNQRVIWEFKWDTSTLPPVPHPLLRDHYFTSPPLHHQGMSMALPEQLLAWKTRGPDCHFHKVVRREAYHRERTTGGLDLYDPEFCNVTQLLPYESLDDFLIHHLPNKNYMRMPDNLLKVRDLHKMRLRELQKREGGTHRVRVGDGAEKKYDGIVLMEDERDPTKRMHFDMTVYKDYVQSGGRLTEEQMKFWEWVWDGKGELVRDKMFLHQKVEEYYEND